MTGLADLPPDSPNQEELKVPSLHARAKTMGLPISTAMRKLKEGKEKHLQLKNLAKGLCWSLIKRRQGYKKITIDMRKELFE